MKTMLFLLLCCAVNKLNAQTIQLAESNWLGEKQELVRINEKSISIEGVDDVHSYRYADSIIEFAHYYYSIVESRKKGNSKSEKPHYDIDYSRFKVMKCDTDSLILQAINPLGFYLATTFKQKRYGASSEKSEFDIWTESGEKPKSLRYARLDSIIRFSAYAKSKIERHVKEVSLSTSCYNSDYQYFTDLHIDSAGLLMARFITKGYSDHPKLETHYYERQLTEKNIVDLDSLISYAGVRNNDSVSFNGWASHSINIWLDVYHSEGKFIITGIRSEFTGMARGLYDFLNRLLEEQFIVPKIEYTFVNSKYEKKD